MSVSVTIENLEGVQAFIKDVDPKMRTALKRIIGEGAMVAMDNSKANAARVTGRYRSSIHIESPGASSNVYADDHGEKFDGKFSESPKTGEVYVGTNVVYAGKLESKYHTLDNARLRAQAFIINKLNELTR